MYSPKPGEFDYFWSPFKAHYHRNPNHNCGPESGDDMEDFEDFFADDKYLSAIVSCTGVFVKMQGVSSYEPDSLPGEVGVWLGCPGEPLTLGRMVADVHKALDDELFTLPSSDDWYFVGLEPSHEVSRTASHIIQLDQPPYI